MLSLSDMIIGSSESLRVALERMTRNRRGVLFVCDQDSHLVGVLSDGDVRRSILNDTLLVSPVDRVMNTDPVTAPSSGEATHLLQRMNIVAVPVVDAEGIIRSVVVEDRDTVQVLARAADENDGQIRTAAGVLAIIPARGGSKRIPRKNLAPVAGRSLLAWSIQAARNAQHVSRVLVSTDDAEIATSARAEGAEVPWLRPESLSADDTSTLDVLVHALGWAVDKLTPPPEVAVLLEPTAPLRTGEHIDRAIAMLLASDADCVAAVSELPHVFHPEEVLTVEQGELKPFLAGRTMDSRRLRNRQSAAYVLNGLVYAVRVSSVLAGRGLFGNKTLPLVTSWEDFLDIDTPDDLDLAAFRMRAMTAS
jgi:CMP-N-acetylneuraminic acid synthetase